MSGKAIIVPCYFKVMSLMKFSLQPEVRDLSFDWTLSQGVSADVVPQRLPNIFVGEMVTLYAIISGAERQVCFTQIKYID